MWLPHTYRHVPYSPRALLLPCVRGGCCASFWKSALLLNSAKFACHLTVNTLRDRGDNVRSFFSLLPRGVRFGICNSASLVQGDFTYGLAYVNTAAACLCWCASAALYTYALCTCGGSEKPYRTHRCTISHCRSERGKRSFLACDGSVCCCTSTPRAQALFSHFFRFLLFQELFVFLWCRVSCCCSCCYCECCILLSWMSWVVVIGARDG